MRDLIRLIEDAQWDEFHTIPVGMLLYHGTSAKFHPDHIETPAWFSDAKEVARFFAKQSKDKRTVIHVFKVEEPIHLPLIRDKDEFADFCETFGFEAYSAEDMRDGLLRSGLPGWIIPDNYLEGADILLRSVRDLSYVETIKA